MMLPWSQGIQNDNADVGMGGSESALARLSVLITEVINQVWFLSSGRK